MSDVLIVGSILKDVYLNIDTRAEKLEVDERGTNWLDLSFDGSKHRFFSRTSTLGGAAVSLDVLSNMGITAEVSGSELSFWTDKQTAVKTTADGYRYILVADGQVTYFTSSIRKKAKFIAPNQSVKYIFVDRSAEVNDFGEIVKYLDSHTETKLVLYVGKNIYWPESEKLFRRASLIFAERDLPNVTKEKVIHIGNKKISYMNTTEHFAISRIDLATHLSIYSLISATVLGGVCLGKTVSEAIKMAKINAENALLDTSLTIGEMEMKLKNDHPRANDDLRSMVAMLTMTGKKIIDSDSISDVARLSSTEVSGVVLRDDYDKIKMLVPKGIVPGVKVTGLKQSSSKLSIYYEMGIRFIACSVEINSENDIEKVCTDLARYSMMCQSNGLVPMLEIGTRLAETSVRKMLIKQFNDDQVDIKACILNIKNM